MLRRALESLVSAVAFVAALTPCGAALASPDSPPASGDPPSKGGTDSTPAAPAAAPAADDALPPRHRIVYSNLLAARINPLGLEDQLSLGYRYRLYDRTDPLWRDGNVRVAFEPSLSPAIGRIGGAVEVQPLTILKLRASYHFMGFNGSFGDVQSFTSPLADFSDSALSLGESLGRNYVTYGGQAELGMVAQVKLGPIALRNELVFIRSDMSLHAGDTVFYDPRNDALVSRHGWLLTNDTDLVYVSTFGLVAGARASVVEPFYPSSAYPAGVPHTNPNGPALRAGPLAALTFFEQPGARVDKVSVVLIANWYLLQRYRTGEDVSQALPYLVSAVAFSGDLMPWKARP